MYLHLVCPLPTHCGSVDLRLVFCIGKGPEGNIIDVLPEKGVCRKKLKALQTLPIIILDLAFGRPTLNNQFYTFPFRGFRE